MLKIRLKRVGRKHDPSFRIIVTEAGRSGQSNKYIDRVGFYDARVNKKEVDVEKAKEWIKKGAQVSPTVYNIFVDAGVIEGRKKNVLPKKTAPVKEEAAPEEVAAKAKEVEGVAEETPEAAPEETAVEETTKTPTEEATPEENLPANEPAEEEKKEE